MTEKETEVVKKAIAMIVTVEEDGTGVDTPLADASEAVGLLNSLVILNGTEPEIRLADTK